MPTSDFNPDALSSRDTYTWRQFEDWCAAVDTTPLPINPDQLLEFLIDHPAKANTHRRRITVINTIHRHAGYPPPGRADAIRSTIHQRRRARREQLLHTLADRLPALARDTGWPRELFARRDAFLLILTATGLTTNDITTLTAADVTINVGADELVITAPSGHLTRIRDDKHPGVSVITIWQQLRVFLAAADHYPSTRTLAEKYRDDALTSSVDVERAGPWPIAVPIDHAGHLPPRPEAMTPAALARLIRAHRSTTPPRRALRAIPDKNDPDTAQAPEYLDDIVLDPHAYERGITARRHANTALEDVSERLDDIEVEADALLANLDRILAAIGEEQPT